MIRVVTLGGLLLAALSLPAFAQKDKDQPRAKVYKTPQEVFDASVEAEAKDDFKTMVAVLAPVAQKEMAAQFAAEFAAERAELKEKKDKESAEMAKFFGPIFSVLDKHGLTEKATPKEVKKTKDAKEYVAAKKAALGVIKDPTAFLVEMAAALHKISPNEKTKDKLTEVKIDGDKASGVVVTTYEDKKKKDKKDPVRFVRIDGSWRIIPSMAFEADGGTKDKKD